MVNANVHHSILFLSLHDYALLVVSALRKPTIVYAEVLWLSRRVNTFECGRLHWDERVSWNFRCENVMHLSLFQWTWAPPAKMTLTVKTANRSWRATPAATASPPVSKPHETTSAHCSSFGLGLLFLVCPGIRVIPPQHRAVWQMGIRGCQD